MADRIIKQIEAAILRVAKERGVIMGTVAANHMAVDVLEAIREPSEGMLEAGCAGDSEGGYECWNSGADATYEANAPRIWRKMIDAALAE